MAREQAARFAVLRFSGLAMPKDVRTKTSELRARVKSHELRAMGPIAPSQCNPQWTPSIMRRNEVMVEVER